VKQISVSSRIRRACLITSASAAACTIGSPPEKVSPVTSGSASNSAARSSGRTPRADRSGIHSGAMQPAQLKGQP
jgi:hypothetical protein